MKAAITAKNDLNAKVADLEKKILENGNTECTLRIRLAESDKTDAEKSKLLANLQNDFVLAEREKINLTNKLADRKKKDNERIQTISALETENGQLKAQLKEMKDINANLNETNEELTAKNERLNAQVEAHAVDNLAHAVDSMDNLDDLNQLSINSPEDRPMTDDQEASILGNELRDEINK